MAIVLGLIAAAAVIAVVAGGRCRRAEDGPSHAAPGASVRVARAGVRAGPARTTRIASTTGGSTDAPAIARGVVMTADGEPLEGVEVSPVPAGTVPGGRMSGARTGPDGRFEVPLEWWEARPPRPGPPPERRRADVAVFDLWAWPPRRRVPVVVAALAPTPGTVHELEIVVGDTGSIEGQIVDERGEGLEGVRLAVAAEGQPWMFAGTSDAAGRFVVRGVDVGRAWIRILRGSPAELPPPAELVDGRRWTVQPGDAFVVHRSEELAEVEVDAERPAVARLQARGERGFLGGVVRDVTGQPVPDVHVWLVREPGQPVGLYAHLHLDTETDDEGRFAFDGLAGGSYTVAAEGMPPGAADDDHHGDRLEHVVAGTAVELTLRRLR